jgi:hypothetical protein
MVKLETVHTTLTDAQQKSLSKGRAVRLKAGQCQGTGVHTLHVRPAVLKKMRKNGDSNKGYQLDLTQDEYTKSNAGGKITKSTKAVGRELKQTFSSTKDLDRELKQTFKRNGRIDKALIGEGTATATLKKVAQNPTVKAAGKKVAKMMIKELITKGVPAATAFLAPEALPFVLPAIGMFGNTAADSLSSELGLGLKKLPEIVTYSDRGNIIGHVPDTSGGSFLGPAHPAMHPLKGDSRLPDNLGLEYPSGGSFKPSGGYGLRGGRHQANNPPCNMADIPVQM